MSGLLKFVSEAPSDRLAVILALVFILMLAAAVKSLWARNRELEREVGALHELEREFVKRAADALGEVVKNGGR